MGKRHLEDSYTITKINDIYYTFTIDSGLDYTLQLDDCTRDAKNCNIKITGGGKIWLFAFYPTNGKDKPRGNPDPKIANTIITFLLKHIDIDKDAIISIYSDLGMGDTVRKNLFTEWFKSAGIDNIEQYDGTITLNKKLRLTVLFIHKHNPDKDNIIKYFTNL